VTELLSHALFLPVLTLTVIGLMFAAFVSELYASVKSGAAAGKDLRAVYKETLDKLTPKYGQWVIFNHCMPFDVTRAYDEATKFPDPRIWTAERDIEMWKALET